MLKCFPLERPARFLFCPPKARWVHGPAHLWNASRLARSSPLHSHGKLSYMPPFRPNSVAQVRISTATEISRGCTAQRRSGGVAPIDTFGVLRTESNVQNGMAHVGTTSTSISFQHGLDTLEDGVNPTSGCRIRSHHIEIQVANIWRKKCPDTSPQSLAKHHSQEFHRRSRID